MLQGNSHILDNLLFTGHCVQQLVGDGVRIAIEHPNPMEAVNFAQPAQQLRQGVFPVKVDSVAGGILGNQDELFGAVLHQKTSLSLDAFHGPAAVAAPDERNGAVSTAVVAALSDFQIGEITGGGEHAPAAKRHFFLFRKSLYKSAFHHPF